MAEKNVNKGMVIDGVAASEAIDSSGEILDVGGCDISDLESGNAVLNYEHRGDDAPGASPNDNVGLITYAKKILKEGDCTTPRERKYWKAVNEIPFVYIKARLYDGSGHPGAIAMAAQIRDHIANGDKVLVRYSIEGSTLQKDGNVLKRSVARRVAATIKPCNRSCVSDVLEDPNDPRQSKGDDKDIVGALLKRSELLWKKSGERVLSGAITMEYSPIIGACPDCGAEPGFSIDCRTCCPESFELMFKAEVLRKALAAGCPAGAPGGRTGGAALSREERHQLWKKTALETLQRHSGPFSKSAFRATLKAALPEADDSFIDHFSDLADEFQMKRRALRKDEPPPPETPPEVVGDASTGDKPLTIRGKPVQPNRQLTKAFFDEATGVLHTPKGSFPMYIPSRESPEMGQAFEQHWNDPKVEAFHGRAMTNWAKVNGLLRAGKLPPKVVMHATLFSQLSPNCLDAETEALTQRGWVKGFDLTMNDVLLTKNALTNRLEWQKPTDLRFFPDYEGPLVEFKSRSFHAVTTPDHEWLVTTSRGHLRIKKSTEINNFNDKIHRTGDYVYNGQSGLTPDEAEVLGWFVTDGHYSRSGACNGAYVGRPNVKYDPPGVYAHINQSALGNPEKCARIEALLQRMVPDEVSAYTGADGECVWTLGPKLTKLMLERSPDRFLTVSSLLDLDRPALERLYEVMILGDGSAWLGKEEWQEKETLVTGRKEQVDAFQVLLTLLGYASSSKWRDMSMYEPKSDKMKNIPKMTGCYVVTKLQRKYVRLEPQHRRTYKGKVGVWCPMVPNLFFIARRSGHIFATKNTPVPMQELMYGHLVDAMRHAGIEADDPRFKNIRADWLGRDRPQPENMPQHSRAYFQNLGSAVRIGEPGANGTWKGSASKRTGRKPGDMQSFMLANNKFDSMAEYHQLHKALVDLANRHRENGRAAVAELMAHKVAADRHEARRKTAAKRGADPGPYSAGPAVHGLAPKTGRYMYGMLGGANMMVPDTHFTRHLFGLDKNLDGAAIEHLKATLWDPNNSEVLGALDRYYAQHHDAPRLLLQHPQQRQLVRNAEDAVFPAFWRHWLVISPHERARGLGSPGLAFNASTDHTPYWEAIDPYLSKSEMEPWRVPAETAMRHAQWCDEYGEIPGAMLYYSFAVPRLLAASRAVGDV